MLIALTLKLIVVQILKVGGKKLKSELIIEASKESLADFTSTCVVLMVLILTMFEQYYPNINIDKIGNFGMAIYVFYTSIKMIIQNIKGLLLNDEENYEIKEEVINELSNFKNLEFKNIKVIKMFTYYSVFIQVKVDDDISIKRYLSTEKKIKKQLKSKNKLIRFIDIEPVEYY